MKKFVIASILAAATISASALDVGVTSTVDFSESKTRQDFGATVGQSYGKLNVIGGFDRFTKRRDQQSRFSVTAGYDIAKFGPVTVTPGVGVAYLNNQNSADGYALTVGVGAGVPITKQVAFTATVTHQVGQSRVKSSDGNTLTTGLKYSF
jgi:hypothetical protein